MILAELPHRGNDPWGSGEWRAKRGAREHKGIDYWCPPGAVIRSPASGRVTKIGFCYPDDDKWRYVEVTDSMGYRHRVFYVNPLVSTGTQVTARMSPIGAAMNIAEKYSSTMKPHVHYEVLLLDGTDINPESL